MLIDPCRETFCSAVSLGSSTGDVIVYNKCKEILQACNHILLYLCFAADDEWWCSPSLTLRHVKQVQDFMRAAGPALQTITSMEIDASTEDCDESMCQEEIAVVLSPLIHSCTSMQQLKVAGDGGKDLLQALADSCPSLTCLDTDNVCVGFIEGISEKLPQVTSTRIRLFSATHLERNPGTLQTYETAISSCLTLISLDTGELAIKDSTWRALPSCLKELHIGRMTDPADPERVFPSGLELPSLRTFYYTSSNLLLTELAGLLRAATGLQQLGVWDVWLHCIADQKADLVALHDRLLAGLVLTNDEEERHGQGLVLRLADLQDADLGSAACTFLASLPVLEHFEAVGVETLEEHVLAQLARIFPKLRMLSVGVQTESSAFPRLKIFPCLQHLEFFSGEANTFCWKKLVILCLGIPKLLYLGLDVYTDDLKSAKAELLMWGRSVEVEYEPGPGTWPWPV